jgi:hypothetical protein
MSAVATQFTKVQVGAAACAVAAAAVLTPAAVAAAKPDLMPATPVTNMFQFSQDVPPWWSPLFGATGPGIGAITTSGLPGTPILSFQPLSLLPGFIQPLFGWFSGLNLGVCVAGLGVSVGPYGTVSVKSGAC